MDDAPKEIKEEAPKKSYNMVLVDDDMFLLNMYSTKFIKEGMKVTAINSSEEALEKFRQGLSPEVLLMDVVMPGMDGIDLLKAIREEKLLPKTVIIVLSNQGQQSDIEKAKGYNVNGYIVKATTIPSEVLREVVRIVEEVHSTQK